MAIRKPQPAISPMESRAGSDTPKLMDAQDRHKGDSTAKPRDAVKTSFTMDRELWIRAKMYAASHQTTVSALVEDGLRRVMGEEE